MPIPKTIWRWAFYDFANSSYILVYTALLLPVWFATQLSNTNHALGAWGIANALATILGIVLALFIGHYSDQHSKLSAFKWSIIVSFIGMILLAFGVKYAADSVFWLYIFTQAFFILALSLSNSILPHLSDTKNSYTHSGFAWGFGYLGGIVALILAMIVQKVTASEYHPLVFLSTAIFYFIFSVYALRGLKTVNLKEESAPATTAPILTGWSKKLLLLGYWFISEGITVILLFITIYLSTELHFSSLKVGLIFLTVQLIAFPATWYGGQLATKFASVKLLGITMLFWAITIVCLVFNFGNWGLAGIVIAGALAVGNSQSYLRAQYAHLIDRRQSGMQFGFYTVASEAAVFVGPIIYGVASDYLHSQRLPLIGLFFTMLLGYILVWQVTKKITY